MTMSKYIIMDGCVIASYYVPESCHRYPKVVDRIGIIVNHVKSSGSQDIRLIVPDVCIPEVFSIFAKYRYGTWNKHVRGHAIDDLRYWTARLSFRNGIHNGKTFEQLGVSRYAILATDLISPADHFHHQKLAANPKQSAPPMGAYDHTIIGMAIHLVKCHGRTNVAILTSDNRMNDILARVKSIPKEEASKLGLIRIYDLRLSDSGTPQS